MSNNYFADRGVFIETGLYESGRKSQIGLYLSCKWEGLNSSLGSVTTETGTVVDRGKGTG